MDKEIPQQAKASTSLLTNIVMKFNLPVASSKDEITCNFQKEFSPVNKENNKSKKRGGTLSSLVLNFRLYKNLPAYTHPV